MLPAIVILVSAIIPFLTILPWQLDTHSFSFPSIPAVGRAFPSIFTLDYEIRVTPKPHITVEMFPFPSPTPSAVVPEALDVPAIERPFLVYKGVVFSQSDFFVAYVACIIGIFFLSTCLTFVYTTRRRRRILRQFINPATRVCVCHCRSLSLPTPPPLPILSEHSYTVGAQISTHAADDNVSGGTRHGLGFHFLSAYPVDVASSTITVEGNQTNEDILEPQPGNHLVVNFSPPIPNASSCSGGPTLLHTSQDISMAEPASRTREPPVTQEDGIQTVIVDPINSGITTLVEQTCTKDSASLEVELESEPIKKLPWFMIPPLNTRYHLRQPQPIPIPNYYAISTDSHSENEVEQELYKDSSLTRRMQRTLGDSHPIPKDVGNRRLDQLEKKGEDLDTRSGRAAAKSGSAPISPVQSNKPARRLVSRKTPRIPRPVGPYTRRK